jgi:hypothetical protein
LAPAGRYAKARLAAMPPGSPTAPVYLAAGHLAVHSPADNSAARRADFQIDRDFPAALKLADHSAAGLPV